MLNSLRRKKAGRPKRTTITISEATQKQLKLLVQKTGVPLPTLLASLAAVGNVNEEMRAQVIKLATALSLKAPNIKS